MKNFNISDISKTVEEIKEIDMITLLDVIMKRKYQMFRSQRWEHFKEKAVETNKAYYDFLKFE